METANIFPVFSQLHRDAGEAEALPHERKALPNDAGLFVVGRETAEQSDEPEQTPETQPPRVTGELPTDLAAALYCLAFLADFFNTLESGDLRHIAEEIGARR